MHHADLRREATAAIAKAASALLYGTAVWYLVWVCGTWYGCVVPGMGVCVVPGMGVWYLVLGVWARGCVFCGEMSDAMG